MLTGIYYNICIMYYRWLMSFSLWNVTLGSYSSVNDAFCRPRSDDASWYIRILFETRFDWMSYRSAKYLMHSLANGDTKVVWSRIVENRTASKLNGTEQKFDGIRPFRNTPNQMKNRGCSHANNLNHDKILYVLYRRSRYNKTVISNIKSAVLSRIDSGSNLATTSCLSWYTREVTAINFPSSLDFPWKSLWPPIVFPMYTLPTNGHRVSNASQSNGLRVTNETWAYNYIEI